MHEDKHRKRRNFEGGTWSWFNLLILIFKLFYRLWGFLRSGSLNLDPFSFLGWKRNSWRNFLSRIPFHVIAFLFFFFLLLSLIDENATRG